MFLYIYINKLNIFSNKDEKVLQENTLEKKQFILIGKKFFDICMNKTLINKKPFIKSNNPYISIVIPVYNVKDRLWSSIRSIQNQNITNLEIILVNDYSDNETYENLKKIKIEDPRVELLNNQKNMGTLYSRCLGTLQSKGKYIFPLDDDDLFFEEGTLDVVSRIAEEGNFDIVEFKGAERYVYDSFSIYFNDTVYSNHENNLILYQPELGQYPRRKNNIFGIYDCFLWAKCIKSDIYKKTINLMGRKIFMNHIIWGEDLITSFVLFRTAKSFKFINKYGISRLKNKSTSSQNTPLQIFYLAKIIYLEVLLKFTEDNFYDKQLLVYETLNFLKNPKKLDRKNTILLKNVLMMIIDNKYITNTDKKKIHYFYQNSKQPNINSI